MVLCLLKLVLHILQKNDHNCFVWGKKSLKMNQSSKKIMATIFWDCEGMLLIDFKEGNTTVNATYYASLLHKLRERIQEKRPRKLTRGVRLHPFIPHILLKVL